jgi:predicted DNA-binding transcriptional regulator
LSGGFLSKVLNWPIRGIWFLFRALLIAWATLAIYYSNLPSAALRLALALVFAAVTIWLLWLSRDRRAFVVFVVLFLGVVAWFLPISPSHDRPWRPEVAVMPRATIDGDRVHITGVRNFEYRSVNDFTVRHEEREVQLSHLTAIDFFVSYWSKGLIGGLVGHNFLSFIFDNASPLSISIETRQEVGEGFNPLASLFKQFELIYVVGDERDLVRVRTNFREETVYLYRLNASPDDARRLFMVYLKRINELADRPEFYHLLSNSCTINIIRYANAAGRRGRFDIRHLLNGLIDSYLYHSGRVDTTLPFDELRRRSQINEAAQAANDAPDFSERIRASLPTIAR